jgi:predicted GIY-YIG superfamily endonuclease
VLAGASYPEGVVARIYIGETGNWKRRLGEHAGDAQKAFTTHVFVMGSFDPAFDKVDALMLQYKLNDLAEQLDRASIIRGVKPQLQRADRMRTLASQADFADVQRLLPTAGCTILEPRVGGQIVNRNAVDRTATFYRRDARRGGVRESAEPTGWNHREDENVERMPPMAAHLTGGPRENRERYQSPAIYVLEHAGLTAYGYQHAAEFVVLPGSHMRREVMPSFAADQQNMQRRNDLIEARAVADVRGFDDRWRLRFERRLPSAPIAAKVLMGVDLKADAWRPISADPRAS